MKTPSGSPDRKNWVNPVAAGVALILSACAPSVKSTSEPIGDGEHCTDRMDLLAMEESDEEMYRNGARAMGERLSINFQLNLVKQECPNGKGYVLENGRVYVYEEVDGATYKVDPFIHFQLRREGLVVPVRKKIEKCEGCIDI